MQFVDNVLNGEPFKSTWTQEEIEDERLQVGKVLLQAGVKVKTVRCSELSYFL